MKKIYYLLGLIFLSILSINSTAFADVIVCDAAGVCTSASGGGGGADPTDPGGLDTQIQFNDSGIFNGDAGLIYNKTNDTVNVAGDVVIAGQSACREDGTNCPAAGAGDVTAVVNLGTDETCVRADGIGKGIQGTGTNCTINDTGKITTSEIETNSAASGAYVFKGLTSGQAIIGVKDIAGTPNPINIPDVTGTSKQVLSTNGGSSQDTTWEFRSYIVPGSYLPTRTSLDNTTSETSLYSFSIPANTIGSNGCILFPYQGQIRIASAANVTINFKFGATTISAVRNSITFAATTHFNGEFRACNRNATNSQWLSFTIFGSTDTGWQGSGPAAINTTSAVTAEVTVQVSVAHADNEIHKDITYGLVRRIP